jgi:hypothetical protein
MTPRPQPQDVLELLKSHFIWKREIQRNQLFDAQGVLDAIKDAEERATHTPAPKPCKTTPDGCNLNETCEGCMRQPYFLCSNQVEYERGAMAIISAKAEREQVLDEFTKVIQDRYIGHYDNEVGDIPDVPVDELADIIRSLREQGAQQ